MKIVYLISILCAMSILACEDSLSPDHAFELGDTVAINLRDIYHNEANEIALSYDSLLSDSRCATDVVCIWQGNASLEMTIANLQSKEKLNLNTHGGKDYPAEASVLGFTVHLIELWPAPCTTCKFSQDAYTAKVVVTKK